MDKLERIKEMWDYLHVCDYEDYQDFFDLFWQEYDNLNDQEVQVFKECIDS